MNSTTGGTFGAELNELRILAHQRIPDIAKVYGNCNRLASTATGGKGAFPPISVMRDAWNGVQQRFERILAESQQNTQATAIALAHAINHFVATDDQAGQDLRSAHDDHQDDASQPSNETDSPLPPLNKDNTVDVPQFDADGDITNAPPEPMPDDRRS